MPTLFDNHAEFNEWFAKNIESYAENKSTIEESMISFCQVVCDTFYHLPSRL